MVRELALYVPSFTSVIADDGLRLKQKNKNVFPEVLEIAPTVILQPTHIKQEASRKVQQNQTQALPSYIQRVLLY